MRIAVEIDNIVRDNNSQALKYFRKGVDSSFNREVDMNCSDLLSLLPFPSNESRNVFREIDYPYELFGCAKTTSKHLHVAIEDWLDEHEDDEIIYFALNESNLMIQSTYFFLSKGSRVRTVIFPEKAKDIWKYCDVAVTINSDVARSKPEDKKLVVINKSDNEALQSLADLTYDGLIEMTKDKDFVSKLGMPKAKANFFTKLKNKVSKLF